MRAMKNDPTKTQEAVPLGEVSLADVAVAAGAPHPEYLLEVAERAGVKVTVLDGWDGMPAVSREDARRLRVAVSGYLDAHLEKNRAYNHHRHALKAQKAAERVAAVEAARAEASEQNKARAEAYRLQAEREAAERAERAEAERQRREGPLVPFDKFDPGKVA